MTSIRKMTIEDVGQSVRVYRSAYSGEPWNEEYTEEEIDRYLTEFMKSDSRLCFVLTENEEILGLAMTILIPGIGAPYLRIEDFCIDAARHRSGCGSRFMELLFAEAARIGCDSILLGTQKGFTSHRFYLKNGFREIESVLLYRAIEK